MQYRVRFRKTVIDPTERAQRLNLAFALFGKSLTGEVESPVKDTANELSRTAKGRADSYCNRNSPKFQPANLSACNDIGQIAMFDCNFGGEI